MAACREGIRDPFSRVVSISAAQLKRTFVRFAVKPDISREPEDLTVRAGDAASFSCSVSGDPRPEVTWRRERDPDSAPGGPGSQLPRGAIVEDGGGRLRIPGAEVEDEGVYVCSAENEAGRAEATASLSVHGEQEHTNSLKKL